jgi:AcrR family transcriptional regulator
VRVKTAQQAEKILDAAARLFGTQRYHEVRMDDIAAEAAVAKGTLYRYFADKEELHAALIDRAACRLRQCVEQGVAGAGGVEAKLAAVVAAVLEFFDRQPHLIDLIARAEVQHGPVESWMRARRENTQLVVRLLGEGEAAGLFRVENPETTALMLLGGLRAVVLMGGKPPRPADFACRLVRDCLYGAARYS